MQFDQAVPDSFKDVCDKLDKLDRDQLRNLILYLSGYCDISDQKMLILCDKASRPIMT